MVKKLTNDDLKKLLEVDVLPDSIKGFQKIDTMKTLPFGITHDKFPASRTYVKVKNDKALFISIKKRNNRNGANDVYGISLRWVEPKEYFLKHDVGNWVMSDLSTIGIAKRELIKYIKFKNEF